MPVHSPVGLVLTKQQAVVAQIEGAIRAYRAGDEACAITLAAAAEGAMPRADGPTIFKSLLGAAVATWGDKKQAVTIFNRERDWLKHHSPYHPREMLLDAAIFYLVRSLQKYHAVYGTGQRTVLMEDFLAQLRREGGLPD